MLKTKLQICIRESIFYLIYSQSKKKKTSELILSQKASVYPLIISIPSQNRTSYAGIRRSVTTYIWALLHVNMLVWWRRELSSAMGTTHVIIFFFSFFERVESTRSAARKMGLELELEELCSGVVCYCSTLQPASVTSRARAMHAWDNVDLTCAARCSRML